MLAMTGVYKYTNLQICINLNFPFRFLELLTQKRRQTADALSAASTSNAVNAPAPNAPVTNVSNASKQASPPLTNTVQAIESKVEVTKPPVTQPKPIPVVNGNWYFCRE